jgi:hypothetical protein
VRLAIAAFAKFAKPVTTIRQTAVNLRVRFPHLQHINRLILIFDFLQINAVNRKRIGRSTICRYMLDSPRLPAMLVRVAFHRNSDRAVQIQFGFLIREYGVAKIGNLFRPFLNAASMNHL